MNTQHTNHAADQAPDPWDEELKSLRNRDIGLGDLVGGDTDIQYVRSSSEEVRDAEAVHRMLERVFETASAPEEAEGS